MEFIWNASHSLTFEQFADDVTLSPVSNISYLLHCRCSESDRESDSESLRKPQLMKQWLICIGQSSTVAEKVMNWSWEFLFSVSAISGTIPLERRTCIAPDFRSTLITMNSVGFCYATQTHRWLRRCEIQYMNTFGVDRKPKDRIDDLK